MKIADAKTVDAISASLAEAYYHNKRYDRSLAVAEALLRKLPQSTSALRLALQAAYEAGGEKEATRIATAHLGDFKNNLTALRAAASIAMHHNNLERSIAIEKQIIDSGRAVESDYNNLTWAILMEDNVTPATLDLANKGMMLSNNQSAPMLHTLAAIQAELDKPADARASLLQRMKVLDNGEPDDNDWYVFGRIAECYGLKEEAAAMYRRLERPKNKQNIPATSYALAQRRLKSMGLAQ